MGEIAHSSIYRGFLRLSLLGAMLLVIPGAGRASATPNASEEDRFENSFEGKEQEDNANPKAPASEENRSADTFFEGKEQEDNAKPNASNSEDEELRALQQALAEDQDQRIIDNETDNDVVRDADNDVRRNRSNSANDDAPATRGIQRAAQAIGNALNPEIALTLNVAASYFSDTPMQMGHHDPHRNGFTFQELELSFAANVDPYFQFKGFLSASEHGVDLEEAYAQTTSLPARLQLRAGKFLNRFGRMNERHAHAWNFLDMPLVMGRFFGDEGLAGTGLEVSWLAPTPWYLEIVASAVHGADARSFRGEDSSIQSMRDFVYVGALKNHFALTDSWSLGWGISGAFGRNNADWGEQNPGVPDPTALSTHGLTQIYGTDVHLRFRPVDAPGYRAFSLEFEFMHRRRDVGGVLLESHGLYGQAVWNITQNWEVGARYEWMSGSAIDDLDPEWASDRQRLSAQGTFYPSHFSRIRLQTNYDRPRWRPRPIVSVMLGLEVSIGAHGAHKF